MAGSADCSGVPIGGPSPHWHSSPGDVNLSPMKSIKDLELCDLDLRGKLTVLDIEVPSAHAKSATYIWCH